jgi:hypothetical protein
MLVLGAPATLYSLEVYAHHIAIEKKTICSSISLSLIQMLAPYFDANGQGVQAVGYVIDGPILSGCLYLSEA